MNRKKLLSFALGMLVTFQALAACAAAPQGEAPAPTQAPTAQETTAEPANESGVVTSPEELAFPWARKSSLLLLPVMSIFLP